MLVLYNKFMILKTKRSLITSEYQMLSPPKKRRGEPIQITPDLTLQEIEAAHKYLIIKAQKYDLYLKQKKKKED